jgi:hypothetical protein
MTIHVNITREVIATRYIVTDNLTGKRVFYTPNAADTPTQQAEELRAWARAYNALADDIAAHKPPSGTIPIDDNERNLRNWAKSVIDAPEGSFSAYTDPRRPS